MRNDHGNKSRPNSQKDIPDQGGKGCGRDVAFFGL